MNRVIRDIPRLKSARGRNVKPGAADEQGSGTSLNVLELSGGVFTPMNRATRDLP